MQDHLTANFAVHKLVPLLILCALAQGCVGVSVSTAKTQRFQNPQLAEEACVQGLRGSAPSATNSPAVSSAWLESHWGKPAAFRRAPSGDTEVWTYKFGLNWNGAILFVLIPVPLELPIGTERVQLLVRDGQVVSGEQRFTHTAGGILGYSLGPCGLTGFGAHSLND